MLVGWGGNNGTTVTAGIIANKLYVWHTVIIMNTLHTCTYRGVTWMTKEGLCRPNYYGSLTQAATCRLGNFCGEEVHAPFSALLPMVHPNDVVLGGWDISGLNLAEAMERAQVC